MKSVQYVSQSFVISITNAEIKATQSRVKCLIRVAIWTDDREAVPCSCHAELLDSRVAIVIKQEAPIVVAQDAIIGIFANRPLVFRSGLLWVFLWHLCCQRQSQHLPRVVELGRERRALQAFEHFARKPRAVMASERQQLLTFIFRRNLFCSHRWREFARYLKEHRAREQVI